jgi:hypothetical protein
MEERRGEGKGRKGKEREEMLIKEMSFKSKLSDSCVHCNRELK